MWETEEGIKQIPQVRGFKLAFLNITSLLCHIDELRTWIEFQNIDILAINESRLDSTIPNECVALKNYNIVRKDRNRNGGGVAIYIRKTINFVNNSESISKGLEAVCVDIIKPNSKPLTVLSCYRPPNGDSDEFYNSLKTITAKVDNDGKELIILGDLNTNLLSPDNNKSKRLFEGLTELYQLKQLITEPTRITETSSSLIDVILTNTPNRIVCSGVLPLGISDHCLIFAIRKIAIQATKKHKIVQSRNFKNFQAESFRADLSSMPWDSIEEFDNPNDMWQAWKNMFLAVVDKHAPLKTRRIRNKKSPWLNSEIKQQMIARDKLKALAIKTNSPQKWADYKNAKNMLNNAIKKTKSTYFLNHFKELAGQPKEIWKTINEVMSRNGKTEHNIQSVTTKSGTYTNPADIAELFNEHFTEIGPSLAAKLPTSSKRFDEYITPTKSTFTLDQISVADVQLLLKNIKTDKATGLDKIPCRLVKEATQVIAVSLCYIFNKSISSGVFPVDFKMAKVTPIYKSELKDNMNNYRPISVISPIAKVFERIIYNQLYSYLQTNNLLSKHQSGFRSSHSTATSLIDATMEWLSNMDNGKFNSVVFLDLSKAFDTVDHSILIQKLRLYGLSVQTLKWFESYLTDRTQCCSINGHFSSFKKIKCGVPQGSILGPLLFLIYINDLPNCVHHSKPRMYADDTNLTTSGRSLKKVIQSTNKDLSNIKQWLLANKLSLNATKTEHMFIGSDDNLNKTRNTSQINIDGHALNSVKSNKCLGVHIDERLSWDGHIDHVSKKISQAIAGLKQARPLVSKEVALAIYNSLIQPLFDYCDVVWDNLMASQATRLQKLKNRAGRVITQQGYDVRSYVIREELGWKTLQEMRDQHKLVLIYKALNNLAPPYLLDYLHLCNYSENYNLRDREMKIALPRPKTNYLKNSFALSGGKLWNGLPTEARLATSLKLFKKTLSTFSFPQ